MSCGFTLPLSVVEVSFGFAHPLSVDQVSCGTSHTLALTRVDRVLEGAGDMKADVYRGGQVFMAGARAVLGIPCEEFTLEETLKSTPCSMVSAGYASPPHPVPCLCLVLVLRS